MSSDPQNLELGNYRVLKRENGTLWELGKGSYGTTYKAEHIGLKRVSALKVINDHLVRDDVAKQRFQQEAQAAASLDHAHIASIHDFGEVDGIFYYAMGYCSGGDLESFCSQRGPQEWSVVRTFALQILGALKAAHDKGMLHRDLKPSNIMLADENEPINLQLIDFGLVKALDHHNPSETAIMATKEGAFMGNPLTASPEQFREEDLDERSDLFSLGVTLWYLLHGGSPFGSVAAAKIAHQRLSVESYDDLLPKNLPGDARFVLNKLLAPKRDDRFRYAQEVIEAIQEKQGLTDSPAENTSEEAESQPEEIQLDDSWEITSPIKQLPYGTYYACYNAVDSSLPATSVFIPDEHSPYLETMHRHARQLLQVDTLGLCNFYREGEIEGTQLYLCQALSSCTLQLLLQHVNRLNVHNDLPLLKQVAIAVDEASANGLSGVEMEDNEIFLSLDPALDRAPLSTEDWPAYFDKEARAEGGVTAGIAAIILPRLVDDTTSREASATIGGDDLASNPLARYAGFLYRVLSGMSAKQTAYLSTVNYVSFSDVSEESNQYLSHIIAGMETPVSALSMLQQVCSNEGAHFDGAAVTAPPNVTATNPAPPQASPSPIPPPKKETQPEKKASAKSQPTPIPPPKAVEAPKEVAPPPKVSPPPKQAAATPKKTRKKSSKPKTKSKAPILALLALLLLAGLGAGGFFAWKHFSKDKPRGEKFVYEGPVEDGIGELTFSAITLGNGASEVPIGLQDSQGVTLGSFSEDEGKIIIQDFPIDVFEDQSRWPLKFASLDPDRYIVIGDPLKKTSFTETSSEAKLNTQSMSLSVRETSVIEPAITFNGTPVDNAQSLLKFLKPKSGNSSWEFNQTENKTRLVLAEGQSFPVQAQLAIPSMQPVDLTIDRESKVTADLALKTRPIKLIGIEAEHKLRFSPDLTKVYDNADRSLLEKFGKVSASGSQILNGDPLWSKSSWEVPTMSGSLFIDYAGQKNVVPITRSTTHLVFIGALTHVPEEPDAMTTSRGLAENGGNPKLQSELALLHNQMIITGKLRDLTLEGMYQRYAFLWNLAAAHQDYPRAQADVGDAYRRGMGTRPDANRAYYWISKAAEAGNPRGLLFLGECYKNGTGCERDPKKALEYFQAASDKGELDATGFLVDHFLDLYEANDNQEALQQAVTLLQEASVENHHHLSYLSGFIYLYGKGVEKDEAVAKQHLDRAKALGNKFADALLRQIK